MRKTKTPIYRQILLSTFLIVVLVLGMVFLFKGFCNSMRSEALENQIYNLCSLLLSEVASDSASTQMDYAENLAKIPRSPIKNLSIYRWTDGKWVIITSLGKETFHSIFLSREFSPILFPDKFHQVNELWISNGNEKSIRDINHPSIICGFENDSGKYLLTAELSTTLTKLIIFGDTSARNRIIGIGFLASILVAIVIVFMFHRNLTDQLNTLSKYIQDEKSEPIDVWNDLVPICEQVERLYRSQQEMRFEFEREAAVITAKSESRLRSLSLLREIASIGNSSNDVSIMMRQILEKLNRFFHTYGATGFIIRNDGGVDIYTTDSAPNEYINEIKKKIEPDSSELSKRKVDRIGFVFLEEVKYVTEGTILDDIARKAGVIGYIRIELAFRNEYIGSLHLYSLRVFPNDETFEKLLKALGEEISVALENRRLYSNLERRLKESLALFEISKALISAIDYDLLLEQILWIVQDSFNFAASSILLLDEEKNMLNVKITWGFQNDITQYSVPVGKGITGWVASTGQPLIVPDVKKDSRFIPTDLDVRSEMAVPLVVGGNVIGVLDVESRETNRFSEQDLWFLSSLAAQASLAIDRAKLYKQLSDQAVRDTLTGLYNRRYCEDFVQNQAKELLLNGTPVSIIMVDINGLKRVNDTYGHSSGDILLIEIADFLKQNFPDKPTARYGGDEFIVFLPDVSQYQLDEIVENLKKLKVRWQLRMTEKHPFPLDFAIGEATAIRPDELELLIDYADNLMYKDKHGLV